MASKLQVTRIANATNLAETTAYTFTGADWFRVRSVQFTYASVTASFTITVECSNDNTNWTAVASGTAVSNSSGSVMVQAGTADALYWRVNANRSSGTLTSFTAFVAYEERV